MVSYPQNNVSRSHRNMCARLTQNNGMNLEIIFIHVEINLSRNENYSSFNIMYEHYALLTTLKVATCLTKINQKTCLPTEYLIATTL